jgi:hypothetical protein
MTLSEAIRQRQAQRSTRENRNRNSRTEKRMDEIATVAEVETDYQRVDRAGDVEIEGHFQSLYQLVDTEAERRAVARAYSVWVASERREDLAVRGSVGGALTTLKQNNPFWLGEK